MWHGMQERPDRLLEAPASVLAIPVQPHASRISNGLSQLPVAVARWSVPLCARNSTECPFRRTTFPSGSRLFKMAPHSIRSPGLHFPSQIQGCLEILGALLIGGVTPAEEVSARLVCSEDVHDFSLSFESRLRFERMLPLCEPLEEDALITVSRKEPDALESSLSSSHLAGSCPSIEGPASPAGCPSSPKAPAA
jgi:hypothetical protein